MSAPSMPPDRSVELRQLELDAAERARVQQQEEEAARQAELQQLRSAARTSGRGTIEDYFQTQGLDTGQYASSIDSEINRIMSGIAPSDPNPGQYFDSAGAGLYDRLQGANRNKQMNQLDSIFAPNFATKRIPFTLDDPYLGSIEAEQRSSADEIIRNMLDRGVITPTGYQAAQGNLDSQAPGVKARLNEIGTNQLSSGQTDLRGVANEARQTASNLRLGQQFDPFEYSSQADSVFNNFIQNLGNNIRAAAPGNLFQTSGLAAIAGAGQGAQNTPFDPTALAGLKGEDDQQTATQGGSIF